MGLHEQPCYCSTCRSRRWREKNRERAREISRHSYHKDIERSRAQTRARKHKRKYGDYEKKTYCEQCGVVPNDSKKLHVHHLNWQSCPDCRRPANDRSQGAPCKVHLTTWCMDCHNKNHTSLMQTGFEDHDPIRDTDLNDPDSGEPIKQCEHCGIFFVFLLKNKRIYIEVVEGV